MTGNANVGHCLTCDHRTLFVEVGPWLANDYQCVRCHSIPRWRGIIYVLDTKFPNWRRLAMHECGAGGPATWKMKREAVNYPSSRYLLPEYHAANSLGTPHARTSRTSRSKTSASIW